MKPLRTLRRQLVHLQRKFIFVISPRIPQRFLHENVPYFCQWESRERAADILSGTLATEDDPNWEASGAATPGEYALWSWNVCGMTCLKMIIAHETGKVESLVPLAKRCTEYGGYTVNGSRIEGLFYKPFLTFLKDVIGYTGKSYPVMTIEDICTSLAKGQYVLASVSPEIRNPASHPTNVGGHLILLLGYDLATKTLSFHNPSGTTPASQEHASISWTDFTKFFAGRGITITKS